MIKSSLGVLFSLVLSISAVPHAMAAKNPTSGTPKKTVAKKATVKNTKSVKAVTVKATGVKAKKGQVAKNGKNSKKSMAAASSYRSGYQRVSYSPSLSAVPSATAGDLAGLNLTPDPLDLKSNAALVMDQVTNEVLFEKNSQVSLPIASITKLMTSLVVVEAHQNMEEVLQVTEEDIDTVKHSHSRLAVGSQLSRANMLHIALMSSENRAANALGRHYPGGLPAFVAAMNAKAKALGMNSTRYVDPTGLSSSNVSSARDLAKLVVAAHQYPIIRYYSTNPNYAVEPGRQILHYRNSNNLVFNPEWDIGLQKTGYISEAGRCLVMQATIDSRPVVMVFLDSKGKQSRLADAARIRKWLENAKPSAMSKPNIVARQG